MRLLHTGWFRRQRRPAPPAHLRIVQPTEEPAESPAPFDLFAFDAPAPPCWQTAQIVEITPVASVAADDVIRLAAQASWPEDHPVARALAAISPVPGDTSVDATAQRTGIWHLSAGRGIQGYVNGFHILVGNEQLMRDGGIAIPAEVAERIAQREARGQRSVLVGARVSAADRPDAHRSLIGVLTLAPGTPADAPSAADSPEPPEHHSSPSGIPSDGPTAGSRISPVGRPAVRRWRSWMTAGVLILLSAGIGAYKSALRVEPGEIAIVRRFGRVTAVCEPGLHFRSLWPVEQVTRLSPRGPRRLTLGLTASSRDPLQSLHVAGQVEYSIADPVSYARNAHDPEGWLHHLAEQTLREALASMPNSAPDPPAAQAAISDAWQIRLNERLEAWPIGLAVTDAHVSRLEVTPSAPASTTPPAALPDDAVPEAEIAALIQAARQDAERLVAEARADADRYREQARSEHDARLERAHEAARQLQARYGGPDASPAEARFRIIRDLISGPLPGPMERIVNPDLVSGCRIYLRKGEAETASLLVLPAANKKPSGEAQP